MVEDEGQRIKGSVRQSGGSSECMLSLILLCAHHPGSQAYALC